jgi:hypothetical protein
VVLLIYFFNKLVEQVQVTPSIYHPTILSYNTNDNHDDVPATKIRGNPKPQKTRNGQNHFGNENYHFNYLRQYNETSSGKDPMQGL